MAQLIQPNSFNIGFFDEQTAIKNFNSNEQRLVGYARLSVDEDGEGYCSIINQKEIIASYVERNFGMSKIKYTYIEDDNVSGYKFNRDGLFKVLNMIENGTCNTIIAKDLSRIGRHSALTQLFIEQCERVGIRIIALDDYDSHKSSDEITLGIRAWSNERVVKDASAKVKKVIKHKQVEGKWICAVPFGYMVKDFKNPVVEVDEEAANIVRRIFDMYINNDYGVNKIARILTSEHVTTPTMRQHELHVESGKEYKRAVSDQWSAGQISKLLGDDFYIGTLRTGKYERRGINGIDKRIDKSKHNTFENHHEAIISQDIFDEVQKRRVARVKEDFRGMKKNESLFHGILKCGECGNKLYYYSRKDLSGRYLCSQYFKYGKSACTSHRIKNETLINITISYLEQIRDRCPEVISALNNEVTAARKAAKSKRISGQDYQTKIAQLESELEMIESQRIKQIIAHPEREASINTIYDKMYDDASANIERLKEEAKAAADKDSTVNAAIKEMRSAIEIINHVIESRTITRRDVEALFESITVYENGDVIVKMRPYIESIGMQEINMVDHVPKAIPKEYSVKNINDSASGEPLAITFTDYVRISHALASLSTKIRRKDY